MNSTITSNYDAYAMSEGPVLMRAPRYVLTFEPLASRPGEQWSAVPDVRVRRLLKHALRGLGLRCTSAREEPAVTAAVRYDLDGQLELTLPVAPGAAVPALHDAVWFAPRGAAPVYAHVVARQYAPCEQRWELYLSLDESGEGRELSPDEEAAWRAAGFRPAGEPEGPAPWEEVGG